MVDFVLLKLFLDGLLFFGFTLFNLLDVEIVFFGLSDVLFLKQNGVLVLALEVRREVLELDFFLNRLGFHDLFQFNYLYNRRIYLLDQYIGIELCFNFIKFILNSKFFLYKKLEEFKM